MSSDPFDDLLEVTAFDEKIVVEVLSKSLDDSTTHAISGRLLRLAEQPDEREMHLDIAEVEFISSTGLGLLIALHKKLRGAGRRLTVLGVSANLYEVFEVTHLHKLLDVRPEAAS